nr:MAG TPA: hypothetical protein [Bacteriophage sp.]
MIYFFLASILSTLLLPLESNFSTILKIYSSKVIQ